MSDQDKAFFATFKVVLGALVLLAVVFYIIAQVAANFAQEDEGMHPQTRKMIEERLAPVGKVAVGEGAAEKAAATATAEPRSGQQVVQAVCAACHKTGTLGAPKIGAKGDWDARLDKGMKTLMDHAINGFKQMPPKGGDASLTEEEIRSSIVYMLEQSDLQAPARDDAAKTASQPEAEPATEAADPSGAATAGAVVPEDADLGKGKQVYNQACMACHDTGAAGAPKKGDAAAWKPRVAKGWDTLVDHAINGFKGMPPKGGNPTIPDPDVKAAVAYLLDQSQ